MDGLNWMIHSWCKDNSVILADEMGLGKTIQVYTIVSNLIMSYGYYFRFGIIIYIFLFSDNLFFILPIQVTAAVWTIPMCGAIEHNDSLAKRVRAMGTRYQCRDISW